MTLRAVTFDCWGTLIADHDMLSARAVRVSALIEAARGRLDHDAAAELLDRAWRTHHAAWLRGEQFGSPGVAQLCVDELALGADTVDRLSAAFEDAGLHGVVEPLPGARETLETLKARGVATALICDAGFTPGRNVRTFLDRHGLLGPLDHLTFSDEIGVPKPHPKMFESTLDALGVRAEEAVHVGDLLRTDVAGARAAGMKTVRITAINDDVARGFSWVEAAAPPPGEKRPPTDQAFDAPAATADPIGAPPFEDADEVVASHHDLLDALRRLGVPG